MTCTKGTVKTISLTKEEQNLVVEALCALRCIYETGNPNFLATNVPKTQVPDSQLCHPSIKPLTPERMRSILSMIDLGYKLTNK